MCTVMQKFVLVVSRKSPEQCHMFACSYHYCTEEAKKSLKFSLARKLTGPKNLAVGPCFLRRVFEKYRTASRSTVAVIRNALSTLPSDLEPARTSLISCIVLKCYCNNKLSFNMEKSDVTSLLICSKSIVQLRRWISKII